MMSSSFKTLAEYRGRIGGGLRICCRFRIFLALISSMVFFCAFTKAETLPVGAPAPTISAKDQDGKEVHLSDIYAKGLTLVYFYPKAGTPGCTAEACSLRDAFEGLKAQGLQIVGVSRDTSDAQKNFQNKYNLPFILIADTNGAVAKAFGVPLVMGIYSSRMSFLVKDGRIVWRSLRAQTRDSAQEVRKALESLK